MTRRCHAALRLPRLQPRRAAAPRGRAGRARTALDRAGNAVPAGTGLSRRRFLLASAGLALSVYGAGRRSPRGVSRRAIAQAADGARPAGARQRVPAGRHRRDVRALPAGDPLYASTGRRSDARRRRTAAFRRTPACTGTRRRRRSAQLHGEGKVSVMPGVGYDRPRPVAFHEPPLLGGRGHQADCRSGWMGRYLDLAGTPDNPLQGLCLDESLQPALATPVPVAADRQAVFLLLLGPGVWGPPQDIMYDYFDALGKVGRRRSTTRRWRKRGQAALMSNSAAPPARPVSVDGNSAAAAARLSDVRGPVPGAHGLGRAAARRAGCRCAA